MTDKKLSEFSAVNASDVSDLVVLFLDGNNAKKNGRLAFSTFVSTLALLAGNNIFTGDNTFSGDVVFSGDVTFNNELNATVSRAKADEDGTNIKSNYVKKTTITNLAYSSSVSLTTNSINKITLTGNVTFSLPTPTDLTILNQIVVNLYMSTAYTIGFGTTTYFGGEAPDLSEAGYYELIYEYDPISSTWVVGALKKASA